MKRILFIYTDFHNYYLDILDSFKRMGFLVDGFSYTLPLRISERIKCKFNSQYINPRIDRLFRHEIQKRAKNEYDYVILLFGLNGLFPVHIKLLRSVFPNAQFIYYIWDSVNNFPKILEVSPLFDKTFSFDRYDCKKYGFSFLPLFYSSKNTQTNIKYDYCSIMTFSLSKINEYKSIISSLPSGLTSCQNIIMRDKASYFYNRIRFASLLKSIDKSCLKFKNLSREEANKIYSESKVTIDVPLQGQSGLTIRTFEVLANNRKLITTNRDIVNYSFYNSNNIYIFDKSTPRIPLSFFELPFSPSKEIDEYSVDSFAKKLLS